MKLLRTINKLKDFRDLWLFIQILKMLTVLPRLISRRSLPDLLRSLDSGVSDHQRNRDRLNKTVGFTDSLLRYRIFQRYGKCLLRSLLLFHFLRRQGWPVEIHFGVRKTAEGLADITGHSWLVLEGSPFLEEECQRGSFATTYSFPR